MGTSEVSMGSNGYRIESVGEEVGAGLSGYEELVQD